MVKSLEILKEFDRCIQGGKAWDLGIEAYAATQELLDGADKDSFQELNERIEDYIAGLDLDGLRLHEIGSMYGGFRRINNFFNSQMIFRFIKDVRGYVFSHRIKGGMAANVGFDRELDYEILLACVPFGMFEPEDLVLVETVGVLEARMDKADILEKLIVANYNIVRGHYHKVKGILDGLETMELTEPEGNLLKSIHMQLKTAMGDGKVFVLHEPYGNNNPYHPLPYERFPKVTTENDKIRINAQMWPDNDEFQMMLLLKVNGGLTQMNGDGFWEIGPFRYEDDVAYEFVVKRGEI